MAEAACQNGYKTKQMLIGPIRKEPPLSLDGAVIDRVKTFKFLGVHVSDDLKCMVALH